ncbi:MAG: hypothetical protein HPY89_01480 [Pelotomaculum sp.]|uniref:Sugar diacid utilization regulator n=1 Tax=Pelotomaculum thermopropionicum (strain DSM 13744 / JCM 10971 / SI) TaxID=370438 RepID=A5D0M4_PELTS|nr:hypothetical protein [Pelotomaculum sp.]BAF60194.1 sugar diacid utilization regulator [Pelotomaculum thermopropionicum SI]
MAEKELLELREFQEDEPFIKEEALIAGEQFPALIQDGLSENISLLLGQEIEGSEIPLEYGGHVIGSIKICREEGQVKGTLDISRSVIEMLLKKAFLVEEQQRESQAKELFVSQLLNQKSSQPNPTLNILGRILGYDLEDPQVVFIVEFEKKESLNDRSPEWNRLRSIAIKIIENFFKFSGGFIVVSYFSGRIVVLKNILYEEAGREAGSCKNGGKEKGEVLLRCRKHLISLGESLRQAILLGTKHDVSIGIGECHRGVLAVRHSYQEAYLALNMGKYFKEVRQSNIYHISDFALESLLSRICDEEKERFIERYLGSIKDEKELQETLEAFFQNNLNIAQAAEKAFLHRNTFTYRLDKIQSLTGLNPRSFYDALVLAIALIMKQIGTHEPV